MSINTNNITAKGLLAVDYIKSVLCDLVIHDLFYNNSLVECTGGQMFEIMDDEGLFRVDYDEVTADLLHTLALDPVTLMYTGLVKFKYALIADDTFDEVKDECLSVDYVMTIEISQNDIGKSNLDIDSDVETFEDLGDTTGLYISDIKPLQEYIQDKGNDPFDGLMYTANLSVTEEYVSDEDEEDDDDVIEGEGYDSIEEFAKDAMEVLDALDEQAEEIDTPDINTEIQKYINEIEFTLSKLKKLLNIKSVKDMTPQELIDHYKSQNKIVSKPVTVKEITTKEEWMKLLPRDPNRFKAEFTLYSELLADDWLKVLKDIPSTIIKYQEMNIDFFEIDELSYKFPDVNIYLALGVQ